MTQPRDKQAVWVTLQDGNETLGRFRSSITELDGQPGYELLGPRFCPADEVVEWEPAKDPHGYDAGLEATE
jgi:hypothetical protein